MRHLKLYEDFATLGNTPGMGSVVPPSATAEGSGDTWGSTAKFAKRRRKKKRPVTESLLQHLKSFEQHKMNEDKKFYYQTAVILRPEEKEEFLKLVPDAEFEIDDEGSGDESVRQLVWSDKVNSDDLAKFFAKVTGQP
jgi:hypothetical protein